MPKAPTTIAAAARCVLMLAAASLAADGLYPRLTAQDLAPPPEPDAGAGEGTSAAPEPATSKLPQPDAAATAGDPHLHQAAAALESRASITARVRQQIDIRGQQLTGVGLYLQHRGAGEPLVRLSLKVQAVKSISSLQQICDGRFLWQRREVQEEVTLSRIDLKRLRDSIGAETAATGRSLPNPLAWGGLPRMLREIHSSFQFRAPAAAQLGAIPVWRLDGVWRPAALEVIAPSQRKAIAEGKARLDKLPEHVPARVVVFLGQADNFPHRIEYHRATGQGRGADEVDTQLLMAIEFFDVSFDQPLDPLQFVYQPDKQEVRDDTNHYLRQLGVRPVEQTATKDATPR